MNPPGSSVPIFATPFAAVNTGADRDLNARLAGLCESTCAAHAASPASRAPPHRRSLEDFLATPDPTVAELQRVILGQAAAVIAGLSTLDAAAFGRKRIQAQGWCSIVQRGGHVPVQHFANASWLAMFCVQAGEPDADAKQAGVLRLHERRLGSMYRDASTADLQLPYRYGHHTWTPQPGWMALFPAHVPHEVSVVRSDTPLIVVFARLRVLEAAADDRPGG